MIKSECKKQIESLKSIEQYCKKHMQENGICDCIFADSNICILAAMPCHWDIEQVVIVND